MRPTLGRPAGPLVDPAFVATMAAYNAEMNRRVYAVAGSLTDEARRKARGLFWSSIQGTLCHLLWADRMWIARFSSSSAPTASLEESAGLIEDFDILGRERIEMDAQICRWARDVDDHWLAGEQVWFSAAARREMRRDRGLLVVHFFNHQTHHRGQVHAALTAEGADCGDTDLFLLV